MSIREQYQDITPWERAIAERWLHVLASLLKEGNKDAQTIVAVLNRAFEPKRTRAPYLEEEKKA